MSPWVLNSHNCFCLKQSLWVAFKPCAFPIVTHMCLLHDFGLPFYSPPLGMLRRGRARGRHTTSDPECGVPDRVSPLASGLPPEITQASFSHRIAGLKSHRAHIRSTKYDSPCFSSLCNHLRLRRSKGGYVSVLNVCEGISIIYKNILFSTREQLLGNVWLVFRGRCVEFHCFSYM